MQPARRQEFLPALTLSLAISFLVSLYGPLELFFTNKDEFHFSFSVLFPELFKLFLLLFVCGLIGFLVCYLIYRRLYQIIVCCAAAGYLAAYIQGMFFSGNLPPLDGRRIFWQDYQSEQLSSLLLWGLVFLAVILLVRFFHMRNMYRVFTGVSLFLTAVLLVTGITVGMQNDGFSPRSDAIVTKDQEFTLSTDQNLLVLVLDAADGRAFSEMLDDHPEYETMLEDFTYYPNTVTAYPFTKHAVPFMLTGQWYENQEDFRSFTTRAMDTSPLFAALTDQGYRMGLYEEEVVEDSDLIYRFENIAPIHYHLSGFRAVAKAELKLVWFKYAPWILKRFARINMEDFQRLLVLDTDKALFTANNPDFYQDLAQQDITLTAEKCFRFHHIEGAHVPFRYDAQVNLIDTDQGDYFQNMECSMTITARYLQKLKDAGVYDNSAILILADHGYGYDQEVPIIGRTNPLLLVKGVGEHHPMSTSQAPISYEDLQTAYERLLSGQTGEAIFDAREGDQRVRRVLLYYYEQDEHMAEYQQQGHAFDVETLLPTGTIYELSGMPQRRPKPSEGPGSHSGPDSRKED